MNKIKYVFVSQGIKIYETLLEYGNGKKVMPYVNNKE